MALNNFIGKRKWKAQHEAGVEALQAGNFVAAEQSLRSALEHATNISERDPAYGETALALGQVLRRTERYDEADAMSKKAFDYNEGVFGATDPRTVRAHLAIVLSKPELSHADMDVRKATFEFARSEFGEKSWQAVRTAALALPAFSSQERETVLADVQNACSAVLGEERVNLAVWPPVAEEFAEALAASDLLELATKFQSLQLKMNEERFGAKSQEAALARIKLGEFFLDTGHPEKAEIAFSRAIESVKLKLGPKSEPVQRATVALGRALARQKKLKEASPYLTEALLTLRPNQVEERIEVLLSLLEYKCLGSGTDSERGALWQELESFWERAEEDSVREGIFSGLLSAQRRLQQAWELTAADRLLHAVLARVRQWRGPHHADVAKVLMEISTCSIGMDDRTKALSFLEQSVALDESVDNLIRATANYAAVGDWNKARTQANQAKRLLNGMSTGVERGRREALLAQALLSCGETDKALTTAELARDQLPEMEHLSLLSTMAQGKVLKGAWTEAVELFRQVGARTTDPYDKAVVFLDLAWVLTQSGRFTEAKEAVAETQALLELRPEHPLGYKATAISAQIAFYSGNVYEGKDIRKKVTDFLKNHGHKQSLRSLSILCMLEPFAPDEFEAELDVGTQILAACEYPVGAVYAFPFKDAACVGLRHITRALDFQEQEEVARERLSQYRERFFAGHDSSNPMSSFFYVTASQLAPDEISRCEALELAVEGLRRLAPRHVALYPMLNRLAKSYISRGQADKALEVCSRALEIRKSPRLVEWKEMLERGELPFQAGADSGSSIELPSMEAVRTPLPQAPTPVIPVPAEEPITIVDEPRTMEFKEPAPEIESEPEPEPSVPDAPAFEEMEAASHKKAAPVLAMGSTADLTQLSMARLLIERGEEPSADEVGEFLDEIRARYGEDASAQIEARMLLALLYHDGAPEGNELWSDALEMVTDDDFLYSMAHRAQEAQCWSLVRTTLEERLQREFERFGENSAETVGTQMRLARALDSAGEPEEAHNRLTLVAEILRSWFGARSKRLLEPLAELIRISDALGDVQSAFEHQLERHKILESSDAEVEDLFRSRISLLPLRCRLGQMDELLSETETCMEEVVGFRSPVALEFAQVLLATAERADTLHWRSDVAASLLEDALKIVPDEELFTACALRVALAESCYRKEYKAQASRIRSEAIDLANSLPSEQRAEIFHLAAESCLRTGEIEVARLVAERVLEDRIAEVGRKDIWAGRALLVMAEADLKSFRLEGTETAIGMSAPSLKGGRYWSRALGLKCQALFFLYRYEEAFELLDAMSEEAALELQLKLAVWRGLGPKYVQQIRDGGSSLVARQWADFENLPLEPAVNLLEFLARAGQAALLAQGMTRIWKRVTAVLPSDVRHARLKLIGARLQYWETDFDGAAATLQQTLELIPPEQVLFPEGLASNVIRGLLLSSLLKAGRATSALTQAQHGASEAAEFLGEEDVRTVAFRVRLAQCARALGRPDDALVLLDEILTPLQDHLGDSHVLLRDVFRGLAVAFLDQEDLESARLSAEEALRIDKEVRGLSLHFVEDLELLADIERGEDIPEALNLIDTALELAEQVLPRNHSYAEILAEKRRELVGAEMEEHGGAPQAEPLSPEQVEDESGDTSESAEVLFEEEEDFQWAEDDSEEDEAAADAPEAPVDSAEALFELESENPEDEESIREEQESQGEVTTLEQLFEIPTADEVEQEVSERTESSEEPAEVDAPENLFQIDHVEEEAPEPEDEFEETEEERAELAAAFGDEYDAGGQSGLSEVDSSRADDDSDETESPENLFAIDAVGEPVDSAEETADETAGSVEQLFAIDPLEEESPVEAADREPDQDEVEGLDSGEVPVEHQESESGEVENLELRPRTEAEEGFEEERAEAEEGSLEEAGYDDVSPAEVPASEEEPSDEEPAELEEEAGADLEEERAEAEEDAGTDSEEERAEAEEDAGKDSEEERAEAEEDTGADSEEERAEAEEDVGADSEEERAEVDEEPVEESVADSAEFVPVSQETSPPRPYKLSAYSGSGMVLSSSASVEFEPDFPEVPLRLPHISEPADEPDEPAPVESEASAEVSVERETDDGAVSLERILEIVDPESYLLPLAPVFFLPVPWKEATEAPFDSQFDDLYRRFQAAYKKGSGWREVVEEAVSVVRRDPGPESGYFLFLLGAQLEKSGNLHTADICLATAIEFLESGSAYGAACHQAGRVAGRRGELGRALEYFDRSAELAGEAELAVLKIDAAECHLGMGRPEEALIGFEEVFGYLEENAPKVQTLAVQAKMAQVHLLIGDPDTSQALAEQTKASLSPKNVGTYRVLGRILLSRAFARLGRYDAALELAEKAWEGAQPWSAKRKDGRRIAISNLVDIYCVVGRFEEALELVFESGLTGWGLAEAEVLLRAGHVSCALGRLENARKYHRLGKAFLSRFRSPALWRSCFHELEAEIYLREGEFQKAGAASDAALKVFEREATGPVDRSRHIVRSAKIMAALGKMDKARDLLEQAYSLRDLHLGAEHPHTSSVEGLTAILP